jgi:hypothetical protein
MTPFSSRIRGGLARHAVALWFSFAAVLYLACTLDVHRGVPLPRSFVDSEQYFHAAENGYFSREMWAGLRAPVPVLVFKLFGEGGKVRIFLELSSALSWATLAWAFSRRLKTRPAQFLSVPLVFSLAASRDVLQWNHLLLSESLSLSAAVLCLSAALLFFGSERAWLVPLCSAAAALAFSRDSNAYLIAFLGIAAGIAVAMSALKRRLPVRRAVLAGAFIGIFLLSNLSANIGKRWQYSMGNVVMFRILPKLEVRKYFEEHGMPAVSPRLKPGNRRAYAHWRLAAVREWADTRGKADYERYLLTHPNFFLLTPVRAAEHVLGTRLRGYGARGFEPAEPQWLELLWASDTWLVRLIAIVALSVTALAWGRARKSPLVTLGVLLALLAYPHALVTFHGDPLEIDRHCLLVRVELSLALVLLLSAIAEALGDRVRQRAFGPMGINDSVGKNSASVIADSECPERNGQQSRPNE